jgi:hypothetical protein
LKNPGFDSKPSNNRFASDSAQRADPHDYGSEAPAPVAFKLVFPASETHRTSAVIHSGGSWRLLTFGAELVAARGQSHCSTRADQKPAMIIQSNFQMMVELARPSNLRTLFGERHPLVETCDRLM